jgi:hypothetical protein
MGVVRMTYLYVLLTIWTSLAVVWTLFGLVAFASIFGMNEENSASKIERWVRAKEELVEAYKDEC